jgi:hypothetical protein
LPNAPVIRIFLMLLFFVGTRRIVRPFLKHT